MSSDACPSNASYYGNRAATLMMLGKFREALGDAQQSVRMDDSFVRVCNSMHTVNPHLQPVPLRVSCLTSVISGTPTGGKVPPILGECHGCQPLLSASSRTGSQKLTSSARGKELELRFVQRRGGES